MQRRSLLSSLAGFGAVGIAGCMANSRPGATLGTDSTETVDQWGEDVERIVVSRGNDTGSEMAILSSNTGVSLPTGTIQFDLENTTRRTFDTNPWAWTLWRESAEGWNAVFPELIRKPLVHIEPGETLSFRLILDDTEGVRTPYGRVGTPDSEHATLGDIAPGEHAVTLSGEFPSGTVRFVSRFEVTTDE